MWARLGQRGAFFGAALPEIAQEKENLKLLTADVATLAGMTSFQKKFPKKFLNVGIAEQNMIGIAAGFAMEGYCVFASTYASFIAVRSLEQVRQHLSHLKLNIKIVGFSTGTMMSKSGISHWATEDLAFTRALPRLQVFSPADALESVKIAKYAASVDYPMYIRISGGPNCPMVYKEDYEFVPGKLVTLREGNDVGIISTGLMVYESLNAANILKNKGISTAVYNMHTIKPIDKDGLKEVFAKYKLIVTIEEHNIIGGMGSAVAEFKATLNNTPRQIFIGVKDFTNDLGSHKYVLSNLGLTAEKIADRIEKEW
jgi:transketolase